MAEQLLPLLPSLLRFTERLRKLYYLLVHFVRLLQDLQAIFLELFDQPLLVVELLRIEQLQQLKTLLLEVLTCNRLIALH